jgi:predicted restriction endonuclease
MNNEQLKRHRERNKRWRYNNREKLREINRKWRLANAEKNKVCQKKWREKNPDYYKNNRTLPYSDFFKKSSPISLMSIRRHGKNAFIIYEKYNKKCAECGQDWDLTIHHIDRQGRNFQEKGLKPNNNIDNLILLCRRCHGRIHGKESRKGKSI